MALIG
jgi:hypothetical protein